MNYSHRIYWPDAFSCKLVGYPLSAKKDTPSNQDNGRIIEYYINDDNQTEERITPY